MFEAQRFVSKHTCILALRQKNNRQASPWVIGESIKRKYISHNHNYLLKSIIEDISNNYGIEVNYHNAWRCRKKALMYVRGSIEMLYQKLPSYLYVLEEKNPGRAMHLETNEIG